MNKFLIIILFGLLILSLPKESYTQDRWVYIDSDETVTIYYDTKTVTRNSDNVEVWIEWYYEKKKKSGSKYIDYTLNKIRLDCLNRTLKYLKFVVYYTDDTSYSSDLDNEPPEEPIPGTFGEVIWEYFCE